MANRQQRRAAAKSGAGPEFRDLLNKLQDAAARAKAEDTDDEADDLNILPKPDKQEIKRPLGTIEWDWNCTENITVRSILVQGSHAYNVFIETTVDFEYPLCAEEAKIVGQALVSAWNWRDVWQFHAGGFIARDMGLVEPEEDSEEDNG